MNMTGGSEFLNWENWDVKKYKGTEAILQIVDQASGGWGHIRVDQISPRDSPANKVAGPPRRGGQTPQLKNARD
jgi:hypothetical protein